MLPPSKPNLTQPASCGKAIRCVKSDGKDRKYGGKRAQLDKGKYRNDLNPHVSGGGAENILLRKRGGEVERRRKRKGEGKLLQSTFTSDSNPGTWGGGRGKREGEKWGRGHGSSEPISGSGKKAQSMFPFSFWVGAPAATVPRQVGFL